MFDLRGIVINDLYSLYPRNANPEIWKDKYITVLINPKVGE